MFLATLDFSQEHLYPGERTRQDCPNLGSSRVTRRVVGAAEKKRVGISSREVYQSFQSLGVGHSTQDPSSFRCCIFAPTSTPRFHHATGSFSVLVTVKRRDLQRLGTCGGFLQLGNHQLTRLGLLVRNLLPPAVDQWNFGGEKVVQLFPGTMEDGRSLT